MDQDSDKNRAGGQRPRRDGEQRSTGRRDDARHGNDPRGNDRPDRGRTANEDRNEPRPRFTRREGEEPRRSNTPPPRFGSQRPDGPRPSRPRTDAPRFNSRPDDRDNRRTDRSDDRDGRPRSSGPGGERTRGDRPGSDRYRQNDAARPSRFGKPGPTRVGGFQPDADERNRAERSRSDEFPRSDDQGRSRPDRRSSRSGDDRPNRAGASSRYSSEQRKDSGERRTGRYDKAPNYNLEQRAHEQRSRNDRSNDRGDDNRANDRSSDRRSDDRSRPADSRPRERYPDPQQPVSAAETKRPVDDGTTRLNRYIANSGVCSRREADELIAKGDISVNGTVVTEMGFRVKEGDMVKYGTKALTPERFVYVLLNKPRDYITTTDDPEERKTVMELVADAGNFRMYPVGRLDRKTTGLLLITNDGELADKLTHPSNNVRKIYQVEIDKPITEEDFETLKRGMELEDGPIKPDAVGIVTPDAQVIGVEIHSGRNRIVRRMFEQLGYDVTKLDRTSFAGLTKKELPRGKWRYLDPKEVIKLKYLS